MRSRCLLLLPALLGCDRAVEKSVVPTVPSVVVETPPEAPPPAPPPKSEKLVPDEEVGPLLARLSETPGDFPSENYVSNETSLLDVAPVLRDPKLRGRAYVGVGPEQNLTYLGLLEPRVAYIVDIRRGNLLEHVFFRACFEHGTTRSAFSSALLSRRPLGTVADDAPFGAVEVAFRTAPVDHVLREEGIARTTALFDRLHIAHSRADDAALARIQRAFATHGLSIAYTMTRAAGEYPTLAEMLAVRDPAGAEGSFLASEASYARVRKLVVENRVLPVVGDFGGKHALRAVGDDMRERGVSLGVFYASNVEQYLFDGRRHAAFVASVAAMPRDDASRIVRVWFDPDRSQPLHRTTQLTITLDAFLERASTKPFKSYREVVTQMQ